MKQNLNGINNKEIDATKTDFDNKRKSKKAYKIQIFTLFFLTFLPQVLFLYILKIFVNQRSDFYGKNNFKLNEDVLLSFYDKNGNFDAYIVNRNSDTDLIYFHGVSICDLEYKKRLEYLKKNVDCNIILPFYRGFCTSKGVLSDIEVMKDIHLLGMKLKERKKKTYIYGLSFGCASSLYFANNFNVFGMILENPFYDLKSVVKDYKLKGYFTFLITDNWPNYKIISKINCNIVFLLSMKDKLIKPSTNGTLLYEICKNALVHYSENSDHTEMYKIDNNHKKHIKKLLL